MELHSGGCAANTGIALGKLGIPTRIVGRVGQDGFGEFMIHELERHGLETRGVVRDPAVNTSATMVMVHSDAERSFLHYRGANARADGHGCGAGAAGRAPGCCTSPAAF